MHINHIDIEGLCIYLYDADMMSKHDDNISHFSMTVTNGDVCDGPTWCIQYGFFWINRLGIHLYLLFVRPFGDGLGKFHGQKPENCRSYGCKNLETHTHIHIKSHRYIYPCI